jgi:hypothetical protein
MHAWGGGRWGQCSVVQDCWHVFSSPSPGSCLKNNQGDSICSLQHDQQELWPRTCIPPSSVYRFLKPLDLRNVE